MSDFTKVTPVKFWCQHVLPSVYDDSLSYMELLNKVVFKLNEVIANTNEIPEYIAEDIKRYITTGKIEEILRELLEDNISLSTFGAVGDGVTDDTKAIKDCIAYAVENKKGIAANYGSYVISDTISIDGSKLLFCHIEGVIKPTFNNKEAVTIINAGVSSDKTAGIPGDYEFHVEGNTYNGGYSFDGVTDYNTGDLPFKGISIKNCYHSHFKLTARNCHIGVSIQGVAALDPSGGCAYNTFDIPNIGDNAVSLDIMAKDYGWANENLFLGVSVQDYSANPNPSKLIGIRLWKNNSDYNPNNNVFIKPSLQCSGLPVLLKDADYNSFSDVRCESDRKPAYIDYYVACKGVCKWNIFEPLYGPNTKIYDNDLSAANNYGNPVISRGCAPKRPVFIWLYDKNKVVKYGNMLAVDGLDSFCPYAPVTSGQPQFAYGDFNDIGIVPMESTPFGRYFDVANCQNVTCTVHSDGDVRWHVHLFDENFNYIDSNTGDVSSTNYTDKYSELLLTTVANHTYFISPNSANDLLITFNINNSNVKYAFIGAIGGSISHLSFYNYGNYGLNHIKTNIIPKRTVNSDALKITNPDVLKVASIGQFVRNNTGEIIANESGNFIILGYIRTGGTDDAQTFTTIKGLVV